MQLCAFPLEGIENKDYPIIFRILGFAGVSMEVLIAILGGILETIVLISVTCRMRKKQKTSSNNYCLFLSPGAQLKWTVHEA
ncbi:hypothetical protein BH11BAC7_BH11BAC7_30700 [soil metagenome]